MGTLRIGEGSIDGGLRRSVARLVAAMMVADGRLTPDELDAAGRLDRAGFGSLAALVEGELAQAVRGPLEIGPACAELRASGPALAGGVVSVLARIAASDGRLAPAEQELLAGIASLLGVDIAEEPAPARPASSARLAAETPRSEAAPRATGALEALGLDETATPEQVTAAYLRLVERYDPLKVAPLGVEFVVLAVHKLVDITAAYERAVR